MTTDFSHTWLSLSQSPCSNANSALLCWERSVKRKYNDGSGKLLQGYNMAHTEGGHGSFSCDAMWCTMPSIAHCRKTSITSRTRSNISSLQDKQCDRGYNLPLASTDHPLQPPHIQTDRKVISKKRIYMAASVEASCGAGQACDMATEHEVLKLKEALKLEKLALRKLYKDLEEERCASATAANEAMAMIRRLQDEKAAALVESQQYKRASEERETYNQEAITLLKDALSIKEHEFFYLQNHIEDYRNVLRKMKSGQQQIQMIESSHLEGDKEKSQLLLLEGKEIASCSLVEPKCLEGDLGEDCDTGDRAPGKSMYWHHYPLDILEGQMGLANLQCENHRSDTVIEEQDFEDVNMSILARVACLEERFRSLGQNEALDPESFDLAPHNMPEEAIFFGCGKTDPVPMHNVELNCLNSAKLDNGFVADNCEDLEDLKSPVFERVVTNSEHGNQEHSYFATFKERGPALNVDTLSSKKHLLGMCKASDGQECSYSEMGNTGCEDVHHVYETQHRANGSAMPYLGHINRSHESGFGDTDFLFIDFIKVLEDEMDNGAMPIYAGHLPFHDGLAGCDTSMNEKFDAEISSAGSEAVKNSVAAKDLQYLKVRLQALEGERAFMKEAIEALRKENMELKLLQEIAHQLQELKGSGCRDRLPFLSFFKRILPFAGLQSLTCIEKRRFFHGCQGSLQTSSNKPKHGGLHHLLNNSFREEKSVCVTRERKVKLAKVETLTVACNLH